MLIPTHWQKSNSSFFIEAQHFMQFKIFLKNFSN